MEAGSLDTLQIIIGLAGGLALFLFGIEQMTDALKLVAGGGMKRLLARLTTNRFSAAAAGAAVTAIIQSSSVTTVLVVGFISAGLMSLTQSIGIIMGANIGTTITAQIIAFKVTKYSLVLVSVGFAMLFASKRSRIRNYGAMVMGLGLIFFGMELMSAATNPLRSYDPFISLMQQMENPFFGILLSAAFTGLIQSSSATTGIIIVLASQGFISLEAGIVLAFGANVGTCVTALLASIGKPREAIQASAVHVLFNIAGVLVWVAFVDQLAWVVREISPSSPGLTGIERLAADTPRQVANAHTLFNVFNTFLFIGFTGPIGWLVNKMLPLKPDTNGVALEPKYLDDLLLDTPALALDRVRMEIRRIGDRAYSMVCDALPVALDGEREDLMELQHRDEEIDALHGSIVEYLARISEQNMQPHQSQLLSAYMGAANKIENIGDLIENNIVSAGLERLESGVRVSPSTQEALTNLHAKICEAVQLAMQSLDSSNPDIARRVLDAKEEINDIADDFERHLTDRLTADEENRLALYRIESEIMEYLKRVYYFAKRIAKAVIADESVQQDPVMINGDRVE
ncbi:MAG: Na/Pi cotransporter family protein [Rhodothermales bacterium]|nr:Na/Pi cotransporter family protein [Rhodothermales bacterium]